MFLHVSPDGCAAPSPCLNMGTCSYGPFQFECACAPDYTGRQCQTTIDDCDPDPCSGSGTCIDGVNNFTCSCNPGFTGELCDVNIDDCADNPCLNSGTCVDGVNYFSCSCPGLFAGRRCELNSTCLPSENTCMNNGVCVANNDNGNRTISCECVAGYTGAVCETEINECDSQPCQNNSTCTDVFNGFSCACVPGTTGQTCEEDVDLCSFADCNLERSICAETNGNTTATCFCGNGFTGTNCNINIDDCLGVVCQNGGECIDLIADFRCNCTTGFSGPRCENLPPHPWRFCPLRKRGDVQSSDQRGLYLLVSEWLHRCELFH